jgi:hypothetical protein
MTIIKMIVLNGNLDQQLEGNRSNTKKTRQRGGNELSIITQQTQ